MLFPLAAAGHQLELKKKVKKPVVEITTNVGSIVVELDPAKAPKTVANFLKYVESKHYDGTIFHRVIANFMIQGGGFTTDMTRKQTRSPIMNEADNGLKNLPGTIAMARTGDPHSATAQFFINVNNNSFLNHRAKDSRNWGYTVFGRVIRGMDVVDKIRSVKTGAKGSFSRDAPQEDIVISKVRKI
ncbi:MAG: peptidylprolyl isomerase [Myxococcota bacterium]